VTLTINDTQHKITAIMLSVIMPSDAFYFILSVVMLSVIMLHVAAPEGGEGVSKPPIENNYVNTPELLA
jgi:hypothetical protein